MQIDTTFFARQQSARRRTRAFIAQFVLLAVPCLLTTFVTLMIVAALAIGVVLSIATGTSGEGSFDWVVGWPLLAWCGGGFAAVTLPVLIIEHRSRLSNWQQNLRDTLSAQQITRNSTHAAARRTLNIVQEMALAAGCPAPALYVWPEYATVNALTVGLGPADATIFVTYGALESLSRDEMQALVAFSMSQVLNGDMTLNVRMTSHLNAFTISPRIAAAMIHPRLAAKFSWIGVLFWLAVLLWVGLLIAIASIPQILAMRFLQSRVGVERQKLADASAVQFTRNAPALKQTLLKALAAGMIPVHRPPLLLDFALCCFVTPVRRRFLPIQQSLPQRIHALDPTFDPDTPEGAESGIGAVVDAQNRWELGAIRKQRHLEAERRADSGDAVPAASSGAAQREFIEKSLLGAALFAATADEVFTSPAPSPASSIATADDARAVVLALVIDRRSDVQRRQLALLAREYTDASLVALEQAKCAAQALSPADRTRALDSELSQLRSLPAGERGRMQRLLIEFAALDALPDVFEYAIARRVIVFLDDLARPREPHGSLRLDARVEELEILFSVLAAFGSPERAADAYEAGMRRLGLRTWRKYSRLITWTASLDAALTRLNRLQPIAKEVLLEALAVTAGHDGIHALAERELLRTVGALLHCPLPRPGG